MSRFSDALDVFKAVEGPLRRWILPDQFKRVETGPPKVVK